MQESGSITPGGAGLNDRPSAAQVRSAEDRVPDATVAEGDGPSATDVTTRTKSGAPPTPRPARRGDPVTRWLVLIIAVVLVLWLAAVVSAMLFGMLTPPSAPRTAAERALLFTEATVKSGSADAQTYARYIGVLIDTGQLSRAQGVLNQALKTAKTDRSYLLARQAQLLSLQKDYEGAVAAANKAMVEAKKELKAVMDKNVKANRKAGAGAVLPTSYEDASLIKAEALLATRDYKGAITVFDLYLVQEPTAADVLVKRGTTKAEIGDTKGAATDYRAALRFIPDYQPALDGLKQIGASK